MRHYDFLTAADTDRLFHRAPRPIDTGADLARLAIGLGATLYMPATRPALAQDLSRLAAHGVLSVVACLEDAIGDHEVATAEANLIGQLAGPLPGPAPLVFVRVRTADQIARIAAGLAGQGQLAGFVLPKFGDHCGADFLQQVRAAGERAGRPLLAMPVLETAELAYAESRIQTLLDIRALLEKFADVVLAVRLGATDLAATYGLRRSRDHTVYDIQLLAAVIGDVVNVFGRAEGYSLAVTGPVWEYFSGTERIFKPLLRESPFIEHAERELRGKLIRKDLDGLIREVALDKANGLVGKTVIHPSHVAAVHALSVVTLEEYTDAVDIVGTNAMGGAVASAYRNKMNESKPHTAWARRTLARADAFGVARASTSFVDLLGLQP
ncbi:MAG TPA: HpcH/HpaI aldolase/citrate lyase family protein [Jatrophihabitans sp.]|nr:HpcH/HpaI aldolase/citrate lyase family protein [Jatrophihabitans sp.]